MSVLEKFQKYTRSPSHRAIGPKCNFFLQIYNEVPEEKKGGLSPPPRATNGPGPQARQGGLSPPLPAGDRGGLSHPPRATGVTPLI